MDITEICLECRNFFAPTSKKEDKSFIHKGTFTIAAKTVTPLDFIAVGQYFRIVGSAMNDGVYQNTVQGLADLTDEVFNGAIWEMSVPRAFLNLCEDITAWRTQNEAVGSANMSPFSGESFAGYSYQKGGYGSTAHGGNAMTWQAQFYTRMNAWRRLSIL